jgi:hypothetical protein
VSGHVVSREVISRQAEIGPQCGVRQSAPRQRRDPWGDPVNWVGCLLLLHRAVLRAKSPDTDDGVTYPFVAAGCTDYVLLVPPTPDDGFPMAAPDPALPTAVRKVPAPAFTKTTFPL